MMETGKQFYGIIPPVPTILFKEGKLDRKGMGNLIDYLIESNVNGLFFLGSGGEFSQMSAELRKEVAEFATSYVNGRVPVLIGTGTPGTNETIALSLHAKKVGADGVVIVNPYYFKLTEESIFQHYCEIAENVDLPILFYNYPELTGVDLSPELVLSLAERYPNIVGIKDTVVSVGHTREMITTVKSKFPDFMVFSGYDDHLLNNLALGGAGSIPLTSTFAPEVSVGIYQAFKQGNYGKAIELHQKLASIIRVYKLDSPFMNVVKAAIHLKGVDISTECLAPVRSATNAQIEELKKILFETTEVKYGFNYSNKEDLND
jgi:2-dehydro-3-deoxy-D-pentonate aldolase